MPGTPVDPLPAATYGRASWAEWWRRERAIFREDLVRRDRDSFAVTIVVFTFVVAAILLLAHASLLEAIGLSLVSAVAMAPITWIWGWKNTHPRRAFSRRFDLLELLAAGVWACVVIPFVIGALLRAFT